MDELKRKPAKHLSLFCKISAFLFFIINYQFVLIIRGIIAIQSLDSSFSFPTMDETRGLIVASLLIGNMFIAIDSSIIIQHLKGTRS